MKPKGFHELSGRITVDEVKLLKEAMKSARLDSCTCSEEAKQEMKLYLESWVASRIERVLKAMKQRDEKRRAKESTDAKQE